MTIIEAINKVDKIVPNNQYTRNEKIEWLNNIDHQIKQEIIDIREGAEEYKDFDGYTAETPEDTELIIGVPYDEFYIFYLKAQIHLYNGEMNRYNPALDTYTQMLGQWRNYYNRKHDDINVPLKF